MHFSEGRAVFLRETTKKSVRDARLFLFDEPLSNLDAQLRDGMRAEIKRLHGEIGKTTIYVTHDQIEAMTLADRIVLMNDGVVEQEGAPLDLFERPKTRFVAGFLGSPQMNFLPVSLSGDAVVLADGSRLPKPPHVSGRAGGALTLGVRPEHLSRAGEAPASAHEGRLDVVIDLVQPTGTRTYVQFRVGDQEVTAELPAHSVERPGARIVLAVDMARVTLFDAAGNAI